MVMITFREAEGGLAPSASLIWCLNQANRFARSMGPYMCRWLIAVFADVVAISAWPIPP